MKEKNRYYLIRIMALTKHAPSTSRRLIDADNTQKQPRVSASTRVFSRTVSFVRHAILSRSFLVRSFFFSSKHRIPQGKLVNFRPAPVNVSPRANLVSSFGLRRSFTMQMKEFRYTEAGITRANSSRKSQKGARR